MNHSPDDGKAVRKTTIYQWSQNELQESEDLLAREVPMEIRVATKGDDPRSIAVTMRTPGHDLELALGFLVTEGVIQSIDQIAGMRRIHDNLGVQNVVEIYLEENVTFDFEQLSRHVFTSSSCGVCGKQTLERLMGFGMEEPVFTKTLSPKILAELPEKLRQNQEVFRQTGGLHAAALFDLDGNLLRYREDIGRHNALDKLIGSLLSDKLLPASNRVLLLSGRTGFELVQKAIFAGIPVIAGIGAPSSFSVTLAQQFNVTLVGFLRADRFNLYSQTKERFTTD